MSAFYLQARDTPFLRRFGRILFAKKILPTHLKKGVNFAAMKNSILFCLSIALFFSACRPEKQATLHSTFYVRYDQTERTLTAEASFFEGDTLETARSKVFQNGVLFWGGGMETQTLPGGEVRYRAEREAKFFPDTLSFTVNLGKDQSKRFPVTLPKITDFHPADTLISKSKPLVLTLDALPLSASEKLLLSFTDAKGRPFQVQVKGPTGHARISIPSGALQSLANGKAQIGLVRMLNTEIQEAGYSTVVGAEYYTKLKMVRITD